MIYLALILLAVLLLGFLLFAQGRRMRDDSGLPDGEVVYSDTGLWETVPEPMLSRHLGLVGRPDYLIRIAERRRTVVVPVEVKSRAYPGRPLAGHILQLAAYCLLVEDHHGQRPPYGLLHYTDRTLRIDFTDKLRQEALDSIEAIRQAYGAPDMRRQHYDVQRCRRCGYAHDCGSDSLVPTR